MTYITFLLKRAKRTPALALAPTRPREHGVPCQPGPFERRRSPGGEHVPDGRRWPAPRGHGCPTTETHSPSHHEPTPRALGTPVGRRRPGAVRRGAARVTRWVRGPSGCLPAAAGGSACWAHTHVAADRAWAATGKGARMRANYICSGVTSWEGGVWRLARVPKLLGWSLRTFSYVKNWFDSFTIRFFTVFTRLLSDHLGGCR